MPRVMRQRSAYPLAPYRRAYPRRSAVGGRGAYYVRKPAVRSVTRRTVRGRGAYYVSGGAYGSLGYGPAKVGAAINAGYGKGNTSKIPPIRGLGAYSVRKNVFLTGDPPSVSNTRWANGGVVIRHREYIGDVISSPIANTFDVATYAINPGLSATFPWLGTVAQNFEEYEMSGMLFEFKTMSSDALNSVNTALGEVIMATQYNAANPPFSSMASMLNYEFSESVKPSSSCIHMIECDPHQSPITRLYVRGGTNPSGTDIRLYDFGSFSIATNGMQGTSVNVGQLWVTYEFVFYKPLLGTSVGVGYYHYAATSAISGVADATPLGTAVATNSPPGANGGVSAVSSLGISIDVVNQRINFPVVDADATYELILSWTTSGAARAVTPPTYGVSGGSFVTVNKTPTVQSFNSAPAAGETATKIISWFFVSVNAGSTAWVNVGTAGALPTVPTCSFNLVVSEAPLTLQNAAS